MSKLTAPKLVHAVDIAILTFMASSFGRAFAANDKDQSKQSKPTPAASSPVNTSRTATALADRMAVPNHSSSNFRPNNPAIIPPTTVRPLTAITPWNANDRRAEWEREQWMREQQLRDQEEGDRRVRDWFDDAADYNRSYGVGNSFAGSGTFVAASKGELIVNANGRNWDLLTERSSKVEVISAVGPSILRPGMFVKLKANFTAQGNNEFTSTDSIGALEVSPASAREAAGSIIPALTKLSPIDGQNPPIQNGSQSLIVVGRLQKNAKGELTLLAAGKTFKSTLDPVATITLRSSDLSLAHAGDQVDVAGYYVRPGYAVAEQVTIRRAKQ